ncbi:MAG: hypothetical protein HWN65_10160 [Candidatus Helarchaeota archaeon]|nr:hypothetical protein [Candidatus Helarchaeota archaeon]
MIEKDAFIEKVKKAIKYTEDIDEPYKIPAFQVILKEFLDEKGEDIKSQSGISAEPKVFKRKMSMVEFLKSIELNSYVEQALAVSYYLLTHEDNNSFKVSDINDCFLRAKLKKPKNLSDTLNSLIKKGLIAETGKQEGSRELYITQSGIKYIEDIKKE